MNNLIHLFFRDRKRILLTRLIIGCIILGILVFSIVPMVSGNGGQPVINGPELPEVQPASDSGASAVAPTDRASFPAWVVQKIGIPLLLESNWESARYPNAKYGAYIVGSGTLTRDTDNLFYGGSASIALQTTKAVNDVTEIKTSFYNIFQKGELAAFEFKWVTADNNSSTRFDVGIEPRSYNIIQGRFRYTIESTKWQYESGIDAFSDFPDSIGGALSIVEPKISLTAGDDVAWARVVVDPVNRRYIGFQSSGNNGLETRDMRPLNLALIDRFNGIGNSKILFFNMVQTHSRSTATMYVTDWCISKIPAGIDPFKE